MIKVVIINHSFQKPEFYKRWQWLAHEYEDLDITLLAPSEWAWGAEKTLTYGHVDQLQGSVVEEERFRIHLIDTKLDAYSGWTSKKMETEIIAIRPDLVYFIGGYTAPPLMQILKLRKREKMQSMKVIAFSMRGHTPTIDFKKSEPGIRKYINTIGKFFMLGPRLKRFNNECDAVFCHYPDALDAFKKEGFKKPIYMQTQVGVDPDIFGPNEESRKIVREKYDIGDAYLFGSASRFHYSKGLSEIIASLPDGGNWKYLMMGWGRDDEVERIKSEIHARGFENRVILTGYIDNWTDMAQHWNALDCAVHVPLTTLRWEETFSLALVQAMITGLPVIGSSSGSVPYQIGPEGIIVPEGNTKEIQNKMVYLMNHPEEGRIIGDKMRSRALNCFSIYHLDKLFYITIKDIMNGVYDESKVDMASYAI